MSTPSESLIVFSDVHLGSDLNDSGSSVPRSTAIDRDLADLIAHYRRTPPPAERWRLVIAGDFIDFVGMSIDAREGDELLSPPTPQELAFGLGGAEDRARLKLRRAAARHPEVFAELKAFVEAGNALTLIQGNHDLEMHWPSVREDFIKLVGGGGGGQVEFEPWFFHRDGLAFIEHGHQYDPFCATPYLFAPLDPRDPKSIQPSLSDCLLRYIVRRTPGMKEYGHEDRGLASYVSWGLGLGLRGTAGLFVRFFRVVGMLRAVARGYAEETGALLQRQHEEGLMALAARTNLSRSTLDAALALHVSPLGGTPRGVLTSVMLDRLAVGLVMALLLVAVFAFGDRGGGHVWVHALIVLALWAVLHVLFSRGRPKVDPAAIMSARASELAKLFPASFVVMGHTHVPVSESVGEATYINLGSWAEEEPEPSDAKPYRAARTHVLIHASEGRHEARLCEWRTGEGPRDRLVVEGRR